MSPLPSPFRKRLTNDAQSPPQSETNGGRMTFMQRLHRIRCWLRGYHVYNKAFEDNAGREISRQYPFRYDVDGMCADCGKVGSGIMPEGE